MKINKDDVIRKYYFTKIVSGCECFACLAGYNTYGMSQTVITFPTHLHGDKMIYSKASATREEIEEAAEKFFSRLEKYSNRHDDEIFDSLTICDFYASYSVEKRVANSTDSNQTQYGSFRDLAYARGLLKSGEEFKQGMQEAIKMNRTPSELRFLVALYMMHGADFDTLINTFQDDLSADLDTPDSEILLKNLAYLFIRMNIALLHKI